MEQNFVSNIGMGGISLAWNDHLSYTPVNPASYSALKTTSFNVAMKLGFKELTQNDYTESFNNSSFGYFSLGFPVGKKQKFGMALGLSPVSKIGFYQTEVSFPPADSSTKQTEEFDYSGGFSKFYGGMAYRINKNISLGANVYYIWGNTSLTHDLYFDNTSYFSLETKKDLFYRNVGFDLGLQYKARISEKWKLFSGVVYNFPVEMNVSGDNVVQTYIRSGTNKYYLDSIKEVTEEDATITKPARLGIGVILQKNNNLKIGFDFSKDYWSEFEDINSSSGLNDQTEYKLGAEIIPLKKGMNSYFRTISYRFGIKYVQSYLKVSENVDDNILTDVEFFSVTGGLGLPPVNRLKKSKDQENVLQEKRNTTSMIDISFEVGMMGNQSGDVFNEMYYNIYIGLRLNDNWFRKSKIY